MPAAYNVQRLYGGPTVQPDSDVIYRGYADAGAGVAAGLGTAAKAFLDERGDQRQFAHQTAMQDKALSSAESRDQTRMEFQREIMDKRLGASKEAREAAKAEREAQTQSTAEAKVAAAFALMESIGSPHAQTGQRLLGSLTDPKAKAAAADQLMELAVNDYKSDKDAVRDVSPVYARDESGNPLGFVPVTNTGRMAGGFHPLRPEAPAPDPDELVQALRAQKALADELGMNLEAPLPGGGKLKPGSAAAPKTAPLQFFDEATNRVVNLDPAQFEIGADGKPVRKGQSHAPAETQSRFLQKLK